MHPWSRYASGLYRFLGVDLGVRRAPAGRSDGGYAAPEIQPRPGVGHLVRAPAGSHVEQVVVHTDDSRYHSGAAEHHHSRPGWDTHLRHRTNVDDTIAANYDRLSGFRRTTGAVDGRDVR